MAGEGSEFRDEMRLIRVAAVGGEPGVFADLRVNFGERVAEAQDAREKFWRKTSLLNAHAAELARAEPSLSRKPIERGSSTRFFHPRDGALDGGSLVR